MSFVFGSGVQDEQSVYDVRTYPMHCWNVTGYLTHWSLNKSATVLHTIFSKTLFLMKLFASHMTTHYLNQYWPMYMKPYGVTRPQWVKLSFTVPWNTEKYFGQPCICFFVIQGGMLYPQLLWCHVHVPVIGTVCSLLINTFLHWLIFWCTLKPNKDIAIDLSLGLLTCCPPVTVWYMCQWSSQNSYRF